MEEEIAYRISLGCEMLSVAALGARFKALGYTLDRTMDARAPARYLTGERAGRTYPACTTGLKETDTGLSAFHYQARRDGKFEAMQRMRDDVFAVSRGAILEV